jgi:hypothetical protein
MHRTRLPVFAALLSIALTSAAFAASDQPTPAAATPAPSTVSAAAAKRPPVNSDDQIICKREDEIGSRLGGAKVCMTRRDWRQQSTDAGDSVNNAPRPH